LARFGKDIQMALIDTQTFSLSRQRLEAAIRLLPSNSDIFSGNRMREARVEFICGSKVLPAIRGWLLAAQIAKNDGRSYLLTEFGKQIHTYDPQAKKAGSWWALHLNICFSARCEPYRTFFAVLGDRNSWLAVDLGFAEEISPTVIEISGGNVAPISIEGNLEGIKKMFLGDSPLSDLGLIETRNEAGTRLFRLGSPEVTDQTLVYALALARERHFRHAPTVNFQELIGIDFHHFLGLSVNKLKRRLRDLSRQQAWEEYLKFAEGKDLESIELRDKLRPRHAVLALLQDADDTWL
jgi:hypothetical protein